MRAYIVLVGLLLHHVAPAPQGTPAASGDLRAAITITAADDGANAPIAGVTITIAPDVPNLAATFALKSVTDENGQVTIAGIAPGAYRVLATPPDRFAAFVAGFTTTEPQTRTVVMSSGVR